MLQGVRDGHVSMEDALAELRQLPFVDLGFARFDTHRALRKGLPEVVLCSGKRTKQVVAAFRALGYKSVTLDLAGYRRGSLNDGVVAIGADQIGVRTAPPVLG